MRCIKRWKNKSLKLFNPNHLKHENSEIIFNWERIKTGKVKSFSTRETCYRETSYFYKARKKPCEMMLKLCSNFSLSLLCNHLTKKLLSFCCLNFIKKSLFAFTAFFSSSAPDINCFMLFWFTHTHTQCKCRWQIWDR